MLSGFMNLEIHTVEEYICHASADTRQMLSQIRTIVKEQSPLCEEMIRYGMPAYKLNGKPLVYFAVYKKHLGFYATPTGHAAFAEELKNYTQGKGSVQFPLNQPIPYKLIARIVAFRNAALTAI